jgi:putative SOS response-associated peptidase YedK
MCGRYTLTADLKKVADRFGAPMPPDEWSTCTPPRFNIAPTQAVIVVGDDGKRYMKQMLWGLIPSWAKAEPVGPARRSPDESRRPAGRADGRSGEHKPSVGPLINARAETLADKPAFRAALRKRRCIIPADGFYEWQKMAGVKQPVRIMLKSKEPFGFAGLWEHWTSPEGEEVLSCVIVTTAANELLKPVHDRMPAILTRQSEAVWLDPKIQEPEKLLPLLKPYPSELMEFYPVSREVNSPAVDKPSIIEPVNGGFPR